MRSNFMHMRSFAPRRRHRPTDRPTMTRPDIFPPRHPFSADHNQINNQQTDHKSTDTSLPRRVTQCPTLTQRSLVPHNFVAVAAVDGGREEEA
ncbi:hypothetical protein niasHS_011241 [Heterodera schachtii]|uniref:Uncharacterized protein n=1 Tax=Heterodera schachtii TaxID=97005 RepID=A0ABD2ITY3_HETSC